VPFVRDYGRDKILVKYALKTPPDRIVFDKYIPVKGELQEMADLMVRFKLIETGVTTGLVEDRFAREANIDGIDGIDSILAN
jgi:NitT/TauT family transport system substrate-binding protein